MRSSVASSSSTNKTTSKSPNFCERRRGTRNNGCVLNKSNDENFGKKRSQRRSHDTFGDSDDDVIQISDEAEPITLSRRSKEEDDKEDKEDKTLFEERLKTTAISICAAVSISVSYTHLRAHET